MNTKICYTPIGFVENDFNEWTPVETLRATSMRIVLDPKWAPGTLGLAPGDWILVLFHFHHIAEVKLQLHPQDDPNVPLRGVFATRTQYRPNPIGATVARLERVENEHILHVRELDALNGTPVLDIKPFVASFDRPKEE
ncbi:MAG: tRNA (N6-threonylcarbamoyladenosine(37)-N6)-methyltransferase TrmO [Ardenticatenia bacterium]|nr:tRNA (N6-threonylcarbamoyladenosine(37)-N6)-methyltransferase TrmO [Ardenticatenia bacterium]